MPCSLVSISAERLVYEMPIQPNSDTMATNIDNSTLYDSIAKD